MILEDMIAAVDSLTDDQIAENIKVIERTDPSFLGLTDAEKKDYHRLMDRARPIMQARQEAKTKRLLEQANRAPVNRPLDSYEQECEDER